MTALDIIGLCADCGLRVEPFDDRLLVVDERHDEPYIPERLFLLLVEHRDEIRDRLHAGYFLKAVLLGELDGLTGAAVNEIRSAIEKHYPPCPARDAALARLEREARP
jgi:hypothetical protein